MIRTLSLSNFKSFREATVTFHDLTFLIGPNAGGKSNLLDALKVLQGLANGLSVKDTLDGRHEEATLMSWPGIRGGSRFVGFRPVSGGSESVPSSSVVKLGVDGELDGIPFWWKVAFDPERGVIRRESLRYRYQDVYDTHAGRVDSTELAGHTISARVYKGQRGHPPYLEFSTTTSILSQVRQSTDAGSHNQKAATHCARALSDIQLLDPTPTVLRQPSHAGATRMGEHGEKFASVSETISGDPKSSSSYLHWLQELTPVRIASLRFGRSPEYGTLFGVEEEGVPDPIMASSLSDGTLRFSALVTAMFEPEPPRILLIEEVENGVHATRLRLLVEMLKECSKSGRPQVVATTHSPLVLACLGEEEYSSVVWVSRDKEAGGSKIVQLYEVPGLLDAVKHRSLADLFSEGWLETEPRKESM